MTGVLLICNVIDDDSLYLMPMLLMDEGKAFFVFKEPVSFSRISFECGVGFALFNHTFYG